jgi:hypothetical protein
MQATAQPEAVAFKVCTLCGQVWGSREEFLADPEVRSIGYQVHFRDLELGLFEFDHERCKTTLAIRAFRFTDLYRGPIFMARLTGTEECPGYCQNKGELQPCTAKCECAYVRTVLDLVACWEKIGRTA